jgi:hypothetical protein
MTSICVVGKGQSRFALKNMVTTLMILDLEVTQLIARFHTSAWLSSRTSNPNSCNARIFLCSKWVSSTKERLLHLPKILVVFFFTLGAVCRLAFVYNFV